MPTLNIDEAKTRLQGLKGRVDNLTTKKEGLQRELTIQEQNRERALQELTDLGYPQVKDMDATALQAFSDKLGEELTGAMGELETVVASTEQLMGITRSTTDLD